MPLSPDEREWIRQQALKQASEAEAKKRMAKAILPSVTIHVSDVNYATGQSPSQLILDHDRQFLAQLKIQADF